MKQLLQAGEFNNSVKKLAAQIAETEKDFDKVAIVGIHTRGVPLAQRLARMFRDEGKSVLEGTLDINLYRDDLSETSDFPILKETKIEFDVNGKVVYLVDDVLYAGRTIRAAMDAVFDMGRPQSVHLVALVKRNGRELPIDTDLVALDVKTVRTDNVKVQLVETDGKDDVTLLEEGEY